MTYYYGNEEFFSDNEKDYNKNTLSESTILDIMQPSTNGNIYQTEKDITDEERYCTKYTSKYSKTINSPCKKLFESKFVIGKKRGRKSKSNNHEVIDDYDSHTKSAKDNLLRKIKVHLFSFIISLINEILQNFNYKKDFINLNQKDKIDVKKNSIKSLKTQRVQEIIIKEISKKFSNHSSDSNKKKCNSITNNIIKEILNEKFITFFENNYLKNDRIINLEKYGSSKVITLSTNVKMLEDLIEKNQINGEDYINKLKYYAQNFFSDEIWLN